MKLSEAKQHIREFMRNNYTDERLSMLLAHARAGRLAYDTCCCFIGIPTAKHALSTKNGSKQTYPLGSGEWDHWLHDAYSLAGASMSERAYCSLANSGNDAKRRRILIPMILAEIKCRDRLVASSAAENPSIELEDIHA